MVSESETVCRLDSVGTRRGCTYIWTSSSWLVRDRASKFKLPDVWHSHYVFSFPTLTCLPLHPSQTEEQCYVQIELFFSAPGEPLCLDPPELDRLFFHAGYPEMPSHFINDTGPRSAGNHSRLRGTNTWELTRPSHVLPSSKSRLCSYPENSLRSLT